MKRRLFILMAGFGATVLTFLATATSASACVWGTYQPVEPKALREE